MLKKILIAIALGTLTIVIAIFGFFVSTTSATEITPEGTARFDSPQATINISNSSQSYQVIWMNAIRAWNRTGVFSFSLSTSPNAQVIAGTNSGMSARFTGLTNLTTNDQGYISHVTTNLNPKILAKYSYLPTEQTNVAEHELGHAIGLLHSPNKASVMYINNRTYGIQNIDIQAVQQLYGSPLGNQAFPYQSYTFQDPFVLKVKGQPEE